MHRLIRGIAWSAMLAVLAGPLGVSARAADDSDKPAELGNFEVAAPSRDSQPKQKLERPKVDTSSMSIDALKKGQSGIKIAPLGGMGPSPMVKPSAPARAEPESRPAPAPQEQESSAMVEDAPGREMQGSVSAQEPVTGPVRDIADTNLVPVERAAPQYPRKAMLAGKQGYVVVEFTVNSRGETQDVNVVDARPRRMFERSALRAVRGWRFKPPMVDGHPGAERVRQRIDFNLRN
ncbi:MAG: TonB family protein [Gammaproteobacteria bacterium]|jgi:protein TonB